MRVAGAFTWTNAGGGSTAVYYSRQLLRCLRGITKARLRQHVSRGEDDVVDGDAAGEGGWRGQRGVDGARKRGTDGLATESRGKSVASEARIARLDNCAERSEGTGSARPRARWSRDAGWNRARGSRDGDPRARVARRRTRRGADRRAGRAAGGHFSHGRSRGWEEENAGGKAADRVAIEASVVDRARSARLGPVARLSRTDWEGREGRRTR